MRIALDAMGGDHAPGPIVAGAVQAVAGRPRAARRAGRRPGPGRAAVCPAAAIRDRLEIFHCTQVVGMEETPVVALRKKPDNSISRCWQLLAEHKVEAIVSAGNTGAMVAGGLSAAALPQERPPARHRRRHADPARPVRPARRRRQRQSQAGASVSVRRHGQHLRQAHSPAADKPTIGLMNVGSEEEKGHDLAKETHALFNASPLREQFIGNIEGRDIHQGVCDVVVTDGFVGNVVLKVCEGVFEFVMKMVVQGTARRPRRRSATRPSRRLQTLVKRYDYSAHRRRPAAGHRRHLHHLPRQLRRPGHQERPGRRRQLRPRSSSTS